MNDDQPRSIYDAAGLPPQSGNSPKPRFWKYLLTVLVTALLTFAITAGVGLMLFYSLNDQGYFGSSDSLGVRFDDDTATQTALEKLRAVLKQVDENFYKDLSDAEMLEAMTRGLVDSLGNPYTMYLTAEQNDAIAEAMSGNYSGIGAFVGLNKDGLVEITEVIAESPAELAGIRAGDLFLEVNGQDVTAFKDISSVAVLVRGTEGTSVDLVLYRPAEQKNISFTVTRRKISTSSVSEKMLSATVGYIMIRDFSQNVSDNFIAAVNSLQAKGAKHIVIDLRNNTGGLATEVISMLDYLLPDTVIATLKGRKDGKEYSESWRSDKNAGVPVSMQYAIIMNGISASASELFAGCLRDNDKARLFGEQSFGKGSGTITIELADGSAINLTNFLYYLPDGESIEGVGLKPDEEVVLPDEAAGQSISRLPPELDTQLKAASAYLESLK